jgi:Tol biopolymer transport system component
VQEGFEGTTYGVSDSGAIAYVQGHAEHFQRRLVWVDRKGTLETLPVQPRAYGRPVISPDGRQVAVNIIEATSGVWIYDFSRRALSVFASGSQNGIWTPDAKRIIFGGGLLNTFAWNAADSSGLEERLMSGFSAVPGSVTPDGHWLVFHGFDPSSPTTGSNIWRLSLDASRQTEVVVRTPALDISPRLSPDGKWLAYVVQSSQSTQVYVTPFPGPGPRLQVSTTGGGEPVWSRSGRELFYRWENKMMAVDVATEPTLAAGAPRQLFEDTFESGTAGMAAYDVADDGRFLMIQPLQPQRLIRGINIVLNWSEELKRLARPGNR